jgi:hypothetical protein
MMKAFVAKQIKMQMTQKIGITFDSFTLLPLILYMNHNSSYPAYPAARDPAHPVPMLLNNFRICRIASGRIDRMFANCQWLTEPA